MVINLTETNEERFIHGVRGVNSQFLLGMSITPWTPKISRKLIRCLVISSPFQSKTRRLGTRSSWQTQRSRRWIRTFLWGFWPTKVKNACDVKWYICGIYILYMNICIQEYHIHWVYLRYILQKPWFLPSKHTFFNWFLTPIVPQH